MIGCLTILGLIFEMKVLEVVISVEKDVHVHSLECQRCGGSDSAANDRCRWQIPAPSSVQACLWIGSYLLPASTAALVVMSLASCRVEAVTVLGESAPATVSPRAWVEWTRARLATWGRQLDYRRAWEQVPWVRPRREGPNLVRVLQQRQWGAD